RSRTSDGDGEGRAFFERAARAHEEARAARRAAQLQARSRQRGRTAGGEREAGAAQRLVLRGEDRDARFERCPGVRAHFDVAEGNGPRRERQQAERPEAQRHAPGRDVHDLQDSSTSFCAATRAASISSSERNSRSPFASYLKSRPPSVYVRRFWRACSHFCSAIFAFFSSISAFFSRSLASARPFSSSLSSVAAGFGAVAPPPPPELGTTCTGFASAPGGGVSE